jgi:hypothetical protein
MAFFQRSKTSATDHEMFAVFRADDEASFTLLRCLWPDLERWTACEFREHELVVRNNSERSGESSMHKPANVSRN